MLQTLRDSFPKWLITAFLGLLALLIVGGALYNPYGSKADNQVVATVNRHKIRISDWKEAFRQSIQLYHFDPAQLTPSQQKSLHLQVLGQLIAQKSLEQWCYANGYRAHPKDVMNYIRKHPTLKNVFLNNTRLAKGYEKASLLKQATTYRIGAQCLEGLTQSAFVLPKELQRAARLIKQQRDFNYLELKAEHFKPSEKDLSHEELISYYNQHLSDFRIAEKVSIDYILLSLSDALELLKSEHPDQPISSEAMQAYFQNKIAHLETLTKDHPQSLSQAASKLSLTIQSTDWFDKQGGSELLTKQQEVINAAFSKTVREGYNSPVIQLDPERVLVLRLKNYTPLRLATFEQAMAQVKEQLSTAKAKEAVVHYAEQCVVLLKSNPNASLDIPKHSEWKKVRKAELVSDHVPFTILKAAFTLSPKEMVTVVVLPTGDCAIIQRLKTKYGKLSQLSDEERNSFEETRLAEIAQLDCYGYLKLSQRKATVLLKELM